MPNASPDGFHFYRVRLQEQLNDMMDLMYLQIHLVVVAFRHVQVFRLLR